MKLAEVVPEAHADMLAASLRYLPRTPEEARAQRAASAGVEIYVRATDRAQNMEQDIISGRMTAFDDGTLFADLDWNAWGDGRVLLSDVMLPRQQELQAVAFDLRLDLVSSTVKRYGRAVEHLRRRYQ